MPDPLTDTDYAALAQFRYSLRAFMAFSEAEADRCGLTPQQHQALLVIRAAPAGTATVGLVAERLIVKPHSASGLVERLVMLGLVSRAPSAHDRRQALLILTDHARHILAQLSATHRAEILRLRPMLVELLAQLTG